MYNFYTFDQFLHSYTLLHELHYPRGQEPELMRPTFIFFDSWGLLPLKISLGKSYHKGATKVKQSKIFVGSVFRKTQIADRT